MGSFPPMGRRGCGSDETGIVDPLSSGGARFRNSRRDLILQITNQIESNHSKKTHTIANSGAERRQMKKDPRSQFPIGNLEFANL
eukprot:1126707-Prorocentrum_minimum.AAC.1